MKGSKFAHSPAETIKLISRLRLADWRWYIEVVKSLWCHRAIRYFFAAGAATVVDVLVYYLVLNKFLHQKSLDFLGLYIFKAPTVSLITSYSAGLLTNFTLTKLFVFTESEGATRWQLLRFSSVAFTVLIANYFFMYFLINYLGWYPTISRAISAITIGFFSFAAHKFFSFKM